MQTVDYKKLGLANGDTLLDLGCGEGRHVISAWLEADIHAVGADLCLDDVKTTAEKFEPFSGAGNDRKTFSLCVSNALKLPFADASFDKVICSEVLEHIPDYRAALAEINRILKPGGRLAVSVPRYLPEKVCWILSDEYHANEGGHVRIFTERGLRKDIERLGFSQYARHWAHALHSPYWWLKCAQWEQQDSSALVSAYHRMLVWDMMERPALTRATERALNPIIGKSVVMYFDKPELPGSGV